MANDDIMIADAGGANQQLQAAVMERLSCGTGTPPGTFEVEVVDGWVVLTGEVDYPFQRSGAACQLEGLKGALGVRNRVTLRSSKGRTIWDDFEGRSTRGGKVEPFILSNITLQASAMTGRSAIIPARKQP